MNSHFYKSLKNWFVPSEHMYVLLSPCLYGSIQFQFVFCVFVCLCVASTSNSFQQLEQYEKELSEVIERKFTEALSKEDINTADK